jgi:hypothetical protein
MNGNNQCKHGNLDENEGDKMKITEKWLNEKDACAGGQKWFKNQTETDGVMVVKKLLAENKLDWANWLIVRIMVKGQYVKYAVFAAEQVAYLWEYKYPDKYKIWKQWVNDGCPTYAYAAAAAAYAAAATSVSASTDFTQYTLFAPKVISIFQSATMAARSVLNCTVSRVTFSPP